MIFFSGPTAGAVFFRFGGKFRLAAFILFVLLFTPVQTVTAHPHVFIEIRLEIVLEDDSVSGFRQYWSFDEYFSAWIMDEFDRNKDGVFNDEEQAAVYQETFVNLENHNYFTRILNRDVEIPVTKIDNFDVVVENNRVVYSFFVPLNLNGGRDTREITIAVYDESFYCQIFFPPAEIEFLGNQSSWKIDYIAQDIPEFSYYFGMLIPTAVKLRLTPL